MFLQEKVLKQYFELMKKPTFKEMAEDTGIQVTRIFRLFNKAPMKLDEFQIFERRVKELTGMTSTLEDMAYECSISLGVEAVKDLELYLLRKLQLWKLKQTKNYYDDAKQIG